MNFKGFVSLIFSSAILTACGGFSESSALKLAQKAPELKEAYYSPLRIATNHFTANPGSEYITKGVEFEQREADDETIHHWVYPDGQFLKFKDTDGNTVKIIGLNLNWRPITFRNCTGCTYCYEKFKAKGLIDFKILKPTNEEFNVSENSFCVSEVKLTPAGEKYVMRWENQVEGEALTCRILNANSGTATMIKIAEKKYFNATKVYEGENQAEFYLDYYYDFTPFGEALYGPTQKQPSFRSLAKYKKVDDNWYLLSVVDLRQNARLIKF